MEKQETPVQNFSKIKKPKHSLCVGWWNLFSSCAVVSVFVLVGNRFLFYILICIWSIIQLWCCVSFFGSGGKQFLVLRTYLEYNTVVRLCHFFCCGRKINFVRIFLFNPNFLLFLVLAGNSFWCYIHTQCTIQLCGCVSFFVVAGKLILYKYVTVTIVSQKYQELSL